MRDSQSIYPIFTFHNVSINSQKLIRFIVPSRQFTFHNVSINSVSSKASQNPLRSFTFHNVSINSHLFRQVLFYYLDLHSTMFLLIPISCPPCLSNSLFTFHNVSINSCASPEGSSAALDLHSTMFLLILVTSVVFGIVANTIYIPQCFY